MTQVAPAAAPKRDGDLDWFRGVGCILMFLCHVAVMIGMPTNSWAYIYHFDGIYQLYAWFFIASGMNAARAAWNDNARPHPGRTTANYLLGNLVLFVLGVIYSVNRRTWGHMELFCGVAACSAVAYLIQRRRWPHWASIIIAVLLIGTVVDYNYLYWNYPHPEMFKLREFNALVLQIINSFNLGERFLFVHFSLLPWVSWFILGAPMLAWTGTKREWIMWTLFIGLFAASFLVPHYMNKMSLDFYLRAKVDFMLRSTALGGVTILVVRRYYKGTWAINKKIEFLGRESLMAFVLQWFFADWCMLLRGMGQATGRPLWMIFPLMQVFTIFGTYWLTKFFAGWRDRTIRHPHYLRNWLTVTLVFFALSLLTYNRAVAISYLVSFPVIVGVAMVFPALRLAVRQKVMPRKPVAPPAAPPAVTV